MTRDETADLYVDKLGCSLAEAYQLIDDDKLTNPIPEVKAIEDEIKAQAPKRRYEKKETTKPREKRVATSTSRVRKADEEKRKIISEIAETLAREGATVEITKLERMVDFVLNGNSYSITLVKHKVK